MAPTSAEILTLARKSAVFTRVRTLLSQHMATIGPGFF